MKSDTAGSKRNPWLTIARPVAFLCGAILSFFAIYTYIATAKMAFHDPGLVLPAYELWTAEHLRNALASMGLPVNFFTFYSMGISLVFNLTFLACGWLILLRRSQDWFGIYLALLLLAWSNGGGVFVSLPEVSPSVNDLHIGWFMWPALFLLLYLFPSGHVTLRWARWLAWAWGLFSVYGLTADILGKLPKNFTYFIPLVIVVLLVGIYSQIHRYRHAGGLERQQIKVVVFSLILMAAIFILVALTQNFTGLGDPQGSGLTGALLYTVILSTIANLAFISVPVSIAVAVLRYRLWDVDIVIRRTLIYGGLTATLALVYFGSVLLLQNLFGAVTGQENSPVAIVISTLAIAALFNPLRKRIQTDIDRRFFRRKYDAEKIVTAFGASLREEVDMDDLREQIVTVVEETLQPETVSMWLRGFKNTT